MALDNFADSERKRVQFANNSRRAQQISKFNTGIITATDLPLLATALSGLGLGRAGRGLARAEGAATLVNRPPRLAWLARNWLAP